MEPQTYIYALSDPACLGGRIRYVGKAGNVALRYLGHLKSVRGGEKSHKASWIRSLDAKGFQPGFETLEEVPFSEWQAIEREYIRVFRAIGIPLTNISAGGDGGQDGMHPTEETRKKLSAALKGVPKSPEHRAKLSLVRMGMKFSPEHCASMSAATKGVPKSAKTRAARLGRKQPPEHIAKRVAAMKVRRERETLAKITNPTS